MSNKQRRKSRKKQSKSQYPSSVTTATHQQEHEPNQQGRAIGPDRFVFVKEIGERMGGVGATCVRKWGREGKIKLRKLFGDSGQYGMPESQLIRIINGGEEE